MKELERSQFGRQEEIVSRLTSARDKVHLHKHIMYMYILHVLYIMCVYMYYILCVYTRIIYYVCMCVYMYLHYNSLLHLYPTAHSHASTTLGEYMEWQCEILHGEELQQYYHTPKASTTGMVSC